MRKKRRYKKRQINKKLVAIIVTAVIVVITAGIVTGAIVFVNKNKDDEKTEATKDSAIPSQVQTTVVETETASAVAETAITETVAEETQPETQEGTVTPNSEQPKELTTLLKQRQKTYDELRTLGCKQLVTVTANSTDAQIKLWECVDTKWVENESKACSGFVGQEGSVDTMSEQICGTPRGLHPIGSAFYHYTAPDTKLDVFQITDNTYWVDDPDSQFYNQRVEGTANQDWDSAEHMADYSNYNYGFVVNYNMPPKYNAGSAIFFHIGSGPTAGCIATSESMVLSYLSTLDKNLCPYILVN